MSPDFSQGRLHAGLAQSTSSVALAWHTAMSNTPIMGNMDGVPTKGVVGVSTSIPAVSLATGLV